MVPSETTFASGRIRSDSDIWSALKACQASDVVERAGGLDATIEPRGRIFLWVNVSYLRFTRALLADRPLLILDEATASVDRSTERKIADSRRSFCEAVPPLLSPTVSARLRNVTEFLVVHRGELVEEGQHSELMAKQGKYAALVTANGS